MKALVIPFLLGVLFTSVLMAMSTPVSSETVAEKPPINGYIIHPLPETKDQREARLAKVAERRKGTMLLVHRGASAFAPENSLEAFLAAMEHGADGVEIDIRRTADGVFYLFHDDDLERMTNGTGKVREKTYYELLEAGLKRAPGRGARMARIPTLDALFNLARRHAMLLHLDVKESGFEEDLIAMIDRYDLWPHIVHVTPSPNSNKIRFHEKAKLFEYKGWLPDGEPDSDNIKNFLAQPGDMVFVKDDPSRGAAILGKQKLDSLPVTNDLRQWWNPDGPVKAGKGE